MGNNPSRFWGGNRPVERVSWEDCQRFCAALSTRLGQKVRLPTEAEWEYSCRAGSGMMYSFGKEPFLLGQYAWYHKHDGDSGETYHVGGRLPNAWGLYDMHGNVWEWCEDGYHGDYDGAPVDGSPWTDGAAPYRILRGGSWYGSPTACACANRLNDTASSRYDDVGFRLVLDDE